MLITIDPDQMFPIGSFERFVVDTIRQIDIGVFDEGDDLGGERPYDPRSILGIVFYGFSRGMFSSRKLSFACTHDVGFMYIAGYAEPTHSTICRFMLRHREALKGVCTQLLYIAEQAGFLDGRMIAVDGTKVKGNASKRFSGTIADFEAHKHRLSQSIERALERQAASDDEAQQSYWKRKEQRYRKNHERIATFLREAQPKRRTDGTEGGQNMTDPDCRIMKQDGRYVCGYNAQMAVDIGSGMIVAADIIDASNDAHAFSFMGETIRDTVPSVVHQRLKRAKYLADGGYYSGDSMAYADDHQLDVYIADRSASCFYQESGAGSSTGARVGARECTIAYDEQGEPLLRCPGGIETGVYSVRSRGRRRMYRFRVGSHRSECLTCRERGRCVGRKHHERKEFEVDAHLLEHHTFVERHQQKLHSDEGKRIYAARMAAIEPVFGDVKQNRGFRSFLRRGMERVQTEWRLIAMGYNLMRMWRLSTP